MMLSNNGHDCEDPSELDSSNGQLLRDIEEISKTLFVHDSSNKCLIRLPQQLHARTSSVEAVTYFPDAKSRSKNERKWMNKGKMLSLWKWKPLKALSHSRQRKYTCCFFCHVHFVENLPSCFDGLSLIVNWKRKDNVIGTALSTVSNGVAEFEETLSSTCSVYATSGGHDNFVKYEAKPFLLVVTIGGDLGIDFGKHWVDLTRFLPVTSEELEEDNCSGKWATSFKLADIARGATLHVSFGFVIVKDKMVELGCHMNLPLILNLKQNRVALSECFTSLGDGWADGTLRRVTSVPNGFSEGNSSSSLSADVKILHEVLPNHGPELTDSKDIGGSARFHFDLEQSKSIKSMPRVYSDDIENFHGNELDDVEFVLIEKGVELESVSEESSKFKSSAPANVVASSIKNIDIEEVSLGERTQDEKVISHEKHNHPCGSAIDVLPAANIAANTTESDMEEVELDFLNMFISENAELNLSTSAESHLLQENIQNRVNRNNKAKKIVKSPSLDELTESVANEFLDLLEQKISEPCKFFDNSPESPTKLPGWQCEKDMLASQCLDLATDVKKAGAEFSFSTPCASILESPVKYMDLSPAHKDGKGEINVKQSTRNKSKAEILEKLETCSLMQKWGLDEEAFQSSPRSNTGGFGSPILLSPKKPVPLPSLCDGLDSLLMLSKGSFLRSLSPTVLRNAEGKVLIMQASGPVVLPAAMGSEILDILQGIASVGTESLSKKLNVMMPLEEVSENVIQQLAQEAVNKLHEDRLDMSQDILDLELEDEWSSIVSSRTCFNSSILHNNTGSECISINDLAPLALDVIEVLLIEGLRIQTGLSEQEAPSSINLNTGAMVSDCSLSYEREETDEYLMDLSISLNEWIKLDAGILGDGDQINEQTSKILAAHHVNSVKDKSLNYISRKHGLMGDLLTIASMMQLRDPERNYEPVGTPMLALLQVQRVLGHADISGDERATEQSHQLEPLVETDDEVKDNHGGVIIPRFRMNQVHIAGFNLDFDDGQMWSTRRRKQSASRWLLASCLNKETRKLHYLKSNAIGRLTPQVTGNSEHGSLLWSITRDVRGIEGEWEDVVTHNAFTRNPDIIFPK